MFEKKTDKIIDAISNIDDVHLSKYFSMKEELSQNKDSKTLSGKKSETKFNFTRRNTMKKIIAAVLSFAAVLSLILLLPKNTAYSDTVPLSVERLEKFMNDNRAAVKNYQTIWAGVEANMSTNITVSSDKVNATATKVDILFQSNFASGNTHLIIPFVSRESAYEENLTIELYSANDTLYYKNHDIGDGKGKCNYKIPLSYFNNTGYVTKYIDNDTIKVASDLFDMNKIHMFGVKAYLTQNEGGGENIRFELTIDFIREAKKQGVDIICNMLKNASLGEGSQFPFSDGSQYNTLFNDAIDNADIKINKCTFIFSFDSNGKLLSVSEDNDMDITVDFNGTSYSMKLITDYLLTDYTNEITVDDNDYIPMMSYLY